MVSHVYNLNSKVMFDIRANIPDENFYFHPQVFVENKDLPVVIEGSEVYDTLCPVSKLTGFRENPLSLLSKVLDPSKARLIDTVLQEIPSLVNEDGRISDSDALDMIVDRLQSGSPSEDAIIRSKLSDMLDVLIPQQYRPEVEQKIQFGDGDANQVDTSDTNS